MTRGSREGAGMKPRKANGALAGGRERASGYSRKTTSFFDEAYLWFFNLRVIAVEKVCEAWGCRIFTSIFAVLVDAS